MGEVDTESKAEMPERPTSRNGGTVKGEGFEGQTPTACEENSGYKERPLLEEVLQRDNLMRAYKKVVQNKGAPGVDGMTTIELERFCRNHWQEVRKQIIIGTYIPKPIRKVDIPKPDGKGIRTLGIPTVLDRMIQQAILQILQPIFDPTFSDSSFGFRPGRSTHGAILRAHAHIKGGHKWVVDLDLEKFFDRVNHDILMSRIARRVSDKRLLLLIRRYLQAGMMEDGLVTVRTEGTPQGSPLSPLLSNILLDDLDKELERRSHHFVRYADDCNVYVKSESAGKRVMSSLEQFLQKKLKLKVNREKSAVARPAERKFLGYTISRQPEPNLTIAPQSIKRLKEKLKPIFRRARGSSMITTIRELNRIIRGWVAYYRHSGVKDPFRKLDAWTRHHLRAIQWRQWKTPRTRFRRLRQIGIPEDQAKCVFNRRGPWRNAQSPHMHLALPNKRLSAMGLVSFFDEHRRLAAVL
jgi:RNA-directed DNA polymerase